MAQWSLAVLLWICMAAHGHAQMSATTTTTAPGKSRSLGLPWRGSLANAIELQPSPTLRRVEAFARRGTFFGTVELVQLLERSAARVARAWPAAQLHVGELSRKQGGRIEGHHSHRNGRDADLAFYVNDAQGRSATVLRFLAFGRVGAALSRNADPHLSFDDRRNWALVAALLTEPVARVQYLFVASEIRNRLLVAGRRAGASTEFLRVAAAVLVQPQRGHKHADHFHLRIFCPVEDQPGCQDEAPFWPWYAGRPAPSQYAGLPIVSWPESVAAPSAALACEQAR